MAKTAINKVERWGKDASGVYARFGRSGRLLAVIGNRAGWRAFVGPDRIGTFRTMRDAKAACDQHERDAAHAEALDMDTVWMSEQHTRALAEDAYRQDAANGADVSHRFAPTAPAASALGFDVHRDAMARRLAGAQVLPRR